MKQYKQQIDFGAEMKTRKVPLNLSIDRELAKDVKAYLNKNRRKGRRSLSELTEDLLISYLRRKGVKLPPLFKTA